MHSFLWLNDIPLCFCAFFIHSSVDGHLDCFHVLAIVNSAAMNIPIHVSFSILVSSGYMPSTIFTVTAWSKSPSFVVCRLFDDDHSDQCEVISHCSFDLHFCNNEGC